MQLLSGIARAAGPGTAGTEIEREMELQATCLGNVFMSSQRDAYPISAEGFRTQDLWRLITRVPNHGSVRNQALWADRGYTSAEPGACNTFRAPRAEVG